MIVTVTDADTETAENHGSVTSVSCIDESGRQLRFTGDTRVMAALLTAALAEGEIQAEIEGWQILGRAE